MKEIGLMFKAPMVRALLDGSKTMTRRLRFSGSVGDHIYVKETFQTGEYAQNEPRGYVYRATDPDWETTKEWKWKSSMFMPRSASRITLEVTAIRQEHLRDISESDAMAEGIEKMTFPGDDSYVCWKNYKFKPNIPGHTIVGYSDPVLSFESLWVSINGELSWSENPTVTVISFRRIK